MLTLHHTEKTTATSDALREALPAGASILGMVFVRLTSLVSYDCVPVTLDYRPFSLKACLNFEK
jgi:hypothetical protein